MLKKILAIVGFAAAVTADTSAGFPEADRITELWQMGNLDFGLYSGYVAVPHTKKELHYIAALSQDNNQTDPVIIWLNGGPGCSSLIGLAIEHGPYVIEDGKVNFTENPYAWNKNASVIYLDAPAGVGFSICGDQQECQFRDINSADDNLEAVKALLQDKFPALKSNALWIGGEAYGGVYVPNLVKKLDTFIGEQKALSPDAWFPNLKGLLVGNGFTNYKYDGKSSYITMAYYHGLIDDELYDFLTQECDITYLQWNDTKVLSDECKAGLKTFEQYTKFVNPFDVFGKCWKNTPQPTPPGPTSKPTPYESLQSQQVSDDDSTTIKKADPVYPQCLWLRPVVEYFNNETVKGQLKINPAYIKDQWVSCKSWTDKDSGFSYTMDPKGSAELYDSLRGKGYKMLKYSGDTDSIVPTLGTQQWINDMNWKVTEEWRPYFVQVSPTTKQVAGYVEVRDDFTLATVHGAGHMAAKSKRLQTYTLITKFIKGTTL